MVRYYSHVTISVTEFKAKCLQLLKDLEEDREPIEITRRGKVVARVVPIVSGGAPGGKAWERLRGTGRLLGKPEAGVLAESDFEAAR